MIIAAGSANNVANGAVLRMEGIDFGGVGAGGNAQLLVSTGKTLSLTATSGTVALSASSITLNGVASSDFARLSQSNIFTGGTQRVQSTSGPRLVLEDAGTDEKSWFVLSQSGLFAIYAATDASPTSTSGANALLSANRTGVVIDTATLTATDITLTGDVKVTGNVGFNNVTPIAKPTVSGSRGGNAALASLLTALANFGLITNSTTA
jgi:hypothetical protein